MVSISVVRSNMQLDVKMYQQDVEGTKVHSIYKGIM